jgi:hypothetical protein
MSFRVKIEHHGKGEEGEKQHFQHPGVRVQVIEYS